LAPTITLPESGSARGSTIRASSSHQNSLPVPIRPVVRKPVAGLFFRPKFHFISDFHRRVCRVNLSRDWYHSNLRVKHFAYLSSVLHAS
jgi:hypothetical protein